ncbi:RNA/RNP complex-1-interacting phosphatase [Sceloporus undulatus]|uniref:RNA/RNP complex-1-interacting phosphatase n=1 Tax=Sceloporus undulatus TaxID=8520 RepID=UPI001C4CE85F|nr:RNA/RNP complex-1-interacting phosphatase [Sceloporus undulatus]
MGNKNKLPDRWTDYLPLGRRIPGTRFIAFKVPLQKSFEYRLAPNERFSPEDLLNQVREQREELGLIIDLTYTTRYYAPEKLPDTLKYCKILTVGHEVPDNETIHQFKSVVKKFLMENQHNDKLIGVHCTHGLNRTGYLVCRYLIDVEGMDPNKAIELFNSNRGHSIERKNYIEDLRRGPKRRHVSMAPPPCSWIKERSGPTPHPDFEIIDCGPQFPQPFPWQAQRHFAPKRGRGGQSPPRPPHHWQSFTTHYQAPPVPSPQFPAAASFIQQRPSPSFIPDYGLQYSPYQQPSQGCGGFGFPRQNSYGPLQQGRHRKRRRKR